MKRSNEFEFQSDLQYLKKFASGSRFQLLDSDISSSHNISSDDSNVVLGQHSQFNHDVFNDDNILNFFEIRLRHLKAKESSSYTLNNGIFTCQLLLTCQSNNYSTLGKSNTKKGAKRDAVRSILLQLGSPSINECYEITKWMVKVFISNYKINLLNTRKFFKDGLHCHSIDYTSSSNQTSTIIGYGSTHIEAEIDALQRLYIYVKNYLPKNDLPKTSCDVITTSVTGLCKYDVGNINYIKSAIVAKWQIRQTEDVRADSGKFICNLQWNWMDFNNQNQQMAVDGSGGSKAEARADAGLKMLSRVGIIDELTSHDLKRAGEIRDCISKDQVEALLVKCKELLSNSNSSLWLFFLLDVFKYGIYKFNKSLFDSLFDSITSSNNLMRPDLWYDLIDVVQYMIDSERSELGVYLLNKLGELPLYDKFFISTQAGLYFKKHRILLALEYNTGLRDSLLSKSRQSDALHGNVISIQPNVIIISGNYTLSTDSRELIYREDNIIALSEASDSTYYLIGIITAVKIEYQRFTINLRVLFDSINSKFNLDSIDCKLIDLGSSIPNKRMVDSLRSFTFNRFLNFKSPIHHRYSPSLQSLIINSYTDESSSVINNRNSGIHDSLVRSMGLTPAQFQACKSAIENELTLIQGPPGTGKTHLACSIIDCWSRIYSFDKILAVADSNIAADNLLQGLVDRGISAIRIGQGSEPELQERAIQGMKKYSEYMSLKESGRYKEAITLKTQMISEALKRARIVIATCVGCGNEMLSSEVFTKVIIDECAQSLECSNIIPLSHFCNQLVLVGDHKQLRPTIMSQEALYKGLSVSLLERLANYFPNCVHLLNIQRRMHPSISQFPNQQFYDCRLTDGENVFLYKPLSGFKWPSDNFYVCFVDVSIGCAGSNYEREYGQSKYNLIECNVVAAVLGNFLSAGEISARQIGILTPYESQKYHLKSKINSCFQSDRISGLEIDSVDGFQGKEKDLIIFSAVRSNSKGSVGFLRDSRRMNVMLTRAKRGIVVVGDRFTLMNEGVNWKVWLQFLSDRNSIVRISDLKEHLEYPNDELLNTV